MTAKTRIEEIDWLRFVCILLVVSFHIVWIEDKYDYIYKFVGIFHVPTFLIISGYLATVDRPVSKIIRYFAYIGLPYLLMETAYILCASRLNISDHIDNLNLLTFLSVLLVKPIGIYWYLHTILICFGALYISSKLSKLSSSGQILVFFLICYFLNMLDMISLTNVFYYLTGVILRKCQFDFRKIGKEGLLAFIPLGFIAFSELNILSNQVLGFIVTMLFIFAMAGVYPFLNCKIKQVANYVGGNTLPIILFSPIFTFLAKYYQQYLISLDSSGIVFLLVTLFITCVGSILIYKINTFFFILVATKSKFFTSIRKTITYNE